MRSEITFKAEDKKQGMDLPQLEEAVAKAKLRGDRQYRVKATVGFGGQLQSITFVEVE